MYRVSWEDRAVASLLEQVAQGNAELRAAATSASLEVEQLLATKPEEVGESRELATRILIVPPLSVMFHINHFEREVTIVSVRVHTLRNS